MYKIHKSKGILLLLNKIYTEFYAEFYAYFTILHALRPGYVTLVLH